MTYGTKKFFRARSGFTLIELLVVLLVIGVLAAILIPVINSARRSAQNSDSVTRMRSLANAVQLFVTENDNRFPGNGDQYNHRWVHKVAPYLGFEADGSANGIPIRTDAYTLHEVFTCPALHGIQKPDGNGSYIARYGLNLELQGVEGGLVDASGNDLGARLAQVIEPASTVMLATKADGAPGLRAIPYPEHPFGVAATLRDDRNPESGASPEGFMGKHADRKSVV